MNTDWWTAMFDKSTDPGNDLMVVQLFLSFSLIFQETSFEMDVKIVTIISLFIIIYLQFSMVCTLIYHTNDLTKCSKPRSETCGLWLHLSF